MDKQVVQMNEAMNQANRAAERGDAVAWMRENKRANELKSAVNDRVNRLRAEGRHEEANRVSRDVSR